MEDMLTPSVKEMEVFLPLMGLRCCTDLEKELVATIQYKPVQIKVETTKDGVKTTLNLCKVEPCWILVLDGCGVV